MAVRPLYENPNIQYLKKKNYLWDGNVLLHEWSSGREKHAVTWVYDEESFTPTAKLQDGEYYSIESDHLGTPTHMYDSGGKQVWSCQLDINGKVLEMDGKAEALPHRYQGQYHDVETGLYYNRFRYFCPEDGRYISVDPLGLASGEFNLYSYVGDSNTWIDPLGLKIYRKKDGKFGKKPGRKSKKDKQRELNNKRQKAVKKAWKQEQELVWRTNKGTRDWNDDEIKELKETGKVSGYEGHHINDVSNNHKQADNPNNIEFLARDEHLAAHDGDFHNQTSGDMIDRQNM
ncbi:MAG: RHS repeat-associated core domain-containing protein [Bacteroidales bacterium]